MSRHCHADGVGPCVASDCPIQGRQQPCPGAEGPQHPTTGALMADDLLADLADAEEANIHARPCQVCEHLATMSEEREQAMRRALAGTIGETKLAEILSRHGFPTGRRAVRRHRQEGHHP